MVLTNDGLEELVDELIGAAFCDYIALGSGTTAASAFDTALDTEVTRKQATLSQSALGVLVKQISLSTSENNGTTFAEVGDFDASSSGTMGMRQTFTGVAKTSSQAWYVEIAYDIDGV